MNLQHYVIREKKLSEKEAVVIFTDVVRVVEDLHKVSVVLINIMPECSVHKALTNKNACCATNSTSWDSTCVLYM